MSNLFRHCAGGEKHVLQVAREYLDESPTRLQAFIEANGWNKEQSDYIHNALNTSTINDSERQA